MRGAGCLGTVVWLVLHTIELVARLARGKPTSERILEKEGENE